MSVADAWQLHFSLYPWACLSVKYAGSQSERALRSLLHRRQ